MNVNINTILVIVFLIAILYLLKIVINNQEKLIKKLSKNVESMRKNNNIIQDYPAKKQFVSTKAGITRGNAKIIGENNEEIIAVIMASISAHTDIPLKSLNIKSIKKL